MSARSQSATGSIPKPSPLIAPTLLLCEHGLRALFARRALVRGGLALALICISALPVRLLGPYEKRWHLADERTFYELNSFDPVEVGSLYFGWSKTLLKFFERHASRPVIALQSVGIISYYTGLPIIDCFGLNEPAVARRRVGSIRPPR